jgi:ParB family transcriptional regulator, chromosome partitioning protein
MEATLPRVGRGLEALMGGRNMAGESHGKAVPIESIHRNPYQPRKQFDAEELDHLSASIKSHGVLQPLVVRRVENGFQLIAGERRLRAATDAGLTEVPVHVVEFSEQQVFEAALVENIQRSDLNPIEKAMGFRDYLEKFKFTQDQLGSKLGIDRTSVSNLLGLLTLPEEVQTAVRHGQISLGHAKILKGLNNTEKQIALCKQVMVQGLSVQSLDQLVKQMKAPQPEAEPAKPRMAVEKTAHVTSLENDLRQRLACKVEIKVKAKEKGQIVIDFETNDDFERVLEVLNR